MTRAAAVIALFALGCAKDPDPNHFKLAKFQSSQELVDTLKGRIPTGSREAAVWEMMQSNGFTCAERGGTLVDQQAGTIGTGKLDLKCSRSTRINFGLGSHRWAILFTLDSARVTDINAGSI
jgi:hypothetical protein